MRMLCDVQILRICLDTLLVVEFINPHLCVQYIRVAKKIKKMCAIHGMLYILVSSICEITLPSAVEKRILDVYPCH